MSNVEHILAAQSKLGEGAVWSVEEQVFYWVDIESNCFSRFYPATGKHETFDVGVSIGVLALRAGGGIVLATKNGFVFWDPQTQVLQSVVNPEISRPHMRFNDGAVDPAGRFLAGSMGGPEEGMLYRLDPDGSVHILETGISVPNGIGWSPDNRIMYFTDSLLRTIYAYDYDVATGNIANRRVFMHAAGEVAQPDGLTVDTEGYIWSAYWDGARVVRFDPSGKVEREIPLPVLRPTSCVFGGPNLDELYITSAWTALTAEQREQYPLSGDLFRLKTDVKGQVKYKFGG